MVGAMMGIMANPNPMGGAMMGIVNPNSRNCLLGMICWHPLGMPTYKNMMAGTPCRQYLPGMMMAGMCPHQDGRMMAGTRHHLQDGQEEVMMEIITITVMAVGRVAKAAAMAKEARAVAAARPVKVGKVVARVVAREAKVVVEAVVTTIIIMSHHHQSCGSLMDTIMDHHHQCGAMMAIKKNLPCGSQMVIRNHHHQNGSRMDTTNNQRSGSMMVINSHQNGTMMATMK